MKKYYILLAFLGLVAGYSAQSEHLFEDERDIYFPITREQLQVKKSSAADLADLSTLSQSELLVEVYNKRVLLNTPHQKDYFEMISKRMSTGYPVKTAQHSRAFDREVKARLGLLQAMAVFWHPTRPGATVEPSKLKNFFAQIAKDKNENLMIRRQAYKNWLALQEHPTHSNSRLASLASHSDENLMGSLAEDAH